MEQKLLFFDIDGTLLSGGLDSQIPESAISSLNQAREAGHLLFINTGRSPSFLPPQVIEYPFDGYICGCGTDITLHGKEIFRYEIPEETRMGMKDILSRCNIQGVFEGRKYLYFNTSEEMIPPVREVYQAALAQERDFIRSFDEPDMDYGKFCVFTGADSDIALFESLLPPEMGILRSEGGKGPWRFMEIVPGGCSKATAIDRVTRYLNKSPDDCYVFGDGPNDLPMLKAAKNSIAMGNSSREIFKEVAYITTPVNRDGIMVAMKHFGLI